MAGCNNEQTKQIIFIYIYIEVRMAAYTKEPCTDQCFNVLRQFKITTRPTHS